MNNFKHVRYRSNCRHRSPCFSGNSASAHHSFATHYDTRTTSSRSTVCFPSVKMRSPHSFFEVDVVNEKAVKRKPGRSRHTRYRSSGGSGLRKETLKVGDTVMFRGPRSRRPEKLLLFGAEIETFVRGAVRNAQFDPPGHRTTAISDTREGVTGIDRFTGKWMTFITGQKASRIPRCR